MYKYVLKLSPAIIGKGYKQLNLFVISLFQNVQRELINLPVPSQESERVFEEVTTECNTLETNVKDFVKFLELSIQFYSLYDEVSNDNSELNDNLILILYCMILLLQLQSERWLTEATILLNNTNAQALACRDQNQVSELKVKLSNFKQNDIPVQKDRVNHMVTLSIQLYGK